ncbi:MAG: M48 family metallopeptidase, partial [Candidatus Riflebacteria bacterium]
LGLLVFLIKSGVFNHLFDRITAMTGAGLLRADLIFIVAFLLFMQLVALPYSFYMGFIKESQMGFSNLTALGWLIRFVKSAVIGMLFETAGILLLLAVIRRFDQSWQYLVPVVMGLFSVAVTLLFPVLVTPLFYQQKPLEPGEFRQKLLEIAAKSGMETQEIYVIDESRYSKHTNAYFTGVGSFRRIVLYDNLIKSHTPDEAALIFAHEAGHWQHNHVAKGLGLGILAMIFLGFLVKAAFPYLASVPWFGFRELASAANLPMFIVLITIFQLFTAPVESQISQYMEVQADTAALELTGLKDVYISAQKRLSADNRSDLTPSPLRVFWLYSHPPALERIELAEKFSPKVF